MIAALTKPPRILWATIKPAIEVLFYLVFFKIPAGIKSHRMRNILYDARSRLSGLALVEGESEIAYIIDTTDKVISKEVFVRGGFDQEKFSKVADFLFQNGILNRINKNLLLDIGANIGTVCLPAIRSNIFQQALAVEADPHNARLLRANINLNGLEKAIQVIGSAVSDLPNVDLQFERSEDNFGDHRVSADSREGLFSEAKRKRVLVQSTTIDHLFEAFEVDIERCMIWMDIQGYEGQALMGATKVLTQKKLPMVVEFWPYGLSRNNGFVMFKQALLPYGYFTDINADPWVRRPVSDLDALWESIGVTGDFTDLLLY